MLEAQVSAREIRRRLWNPPGGHQSSELEVVSSAEQRRRDLGKVAKEAFEAHTRRQELFQTFVEVHARTGFAFGTAERDKTKPVSFEQIVRVVCFHFKQTRMHVFSDRRKAKLVKPRQVIMYLCTEYTAMSFPMIGRLIGGRDHTTCLHGHRKIAAAVLAGQDEGLIADIAAIKATLGIE